MNNLAFMKNCPASKIGCQVYAMSVWDLFSALRWEVELVKISVGYGEFN